MAITQQSPTGPQLMFFARLTSTLSDVTGDGTNYTIVYDATDVNVGTCYNTSTGVFTAPTTGIYMFQVSTLLGNIDASHTGAVMKLQNTTTSFDSLYAYDNPYVHSSGGYLVYQGMFYFTPLSITSGNTIISIAAVANGTKTVDIILNTASQIATWWACYKVT